MASPPSEYNDTKNEDIANEINIMMIVGMKGELTVVE
jgi:hypothetical protein